VDFRFEHIVAMATYTQAPTSSTQSAVYTIAAPTASMPMMYQLQPQAVTMPAAPTYTYTMPMPIPMAGTAPTSSASAFASLQGSTAGSLLTGGGVPMEPTTTSSLMQRLDKWLLKQA